jgi:hypothetical protein
VSLTPNIYSYSFIIRDGILQRIKQVPTFASVKKFSTTVANRIQPADQIPYFGCYLIDEQLTPDGDANAGEPRFLHTVKIGFSVVIANNDAEAAEASLDSAHWALMNLLTNPAWHRFVVPGYEPIHIEGITRGSRKHIFGNAANTNETPLAELRMDLTFTHRTSFRPGPFDDLKSMHVTVAYPWPYDPGAYDPPFTVEYQFPIQGEFLIAPYSLGRPTFGRPLLTIN